MRLLDAQFSIQAFGADYRVYFHAGTNTCQVYCGEAMLGEYDNSKWVNKPCMTHAMRLVRLAAGKVALGAHAKKAVKKIRPKLKVIK